MKALALATLGAAGLLAACADTAPPAAGSAPPMATAAPVVASPLQDFERRQRERAERLQREGTSADAALAWEALTLLRPESGEYTEKLATTRRQLAATAADHLHRAAQALRLGDLDTAAQHDLAALAAEPDNAEAAAALRRIEAERNKRNYLGKSSRTTLTRRAMADGEMHDTRDSHDTHDTQAAALDRNDYEHAAMLVAQGDYDDAIALMQRRLAADRHDAQARHQLAEAHCRHGEALAAGDKAAAIAALQACLKLEPRRPAAAALLAQLRAPRRVTSAD